MNSVDKIKKLCKERKVSLHRLEVECGFANGYISQLKKGCLPYERLKAVSRFFGVSVDSLASDEENTPTADQSSERDSEIVDLLRKLTPNEEEKVTDYIRFLLASRKV